MKCTAILLLALAAVAFARPDSIFDFSDEDMHLDMDIDDSNTYTGSYSWTSPEGKEFFVKYIADRHGYRIVESNAVPVTANGVRADGTQVPFSSEENDSFDDSHDRD
uniref:Cuticle protein CB5 n=1 Tax=Portunus pelagicus TaxID=80836 RepID=A1YLE3_PORPE|nr:cuticle protein CB5 [Portunus pelagicus]